MPDQSSFITPLPMTLIATGKALPGQRITAAELDLRLGRPQGYSLAQSGIQSRHLADPGDDQAVLAAQALHDALRQGDIALASIDLLISASAIPVQALPCSAAHVLAQAGLPDGTPGFDINASCVGFITALHTAAALLNSGAYRRIAIVCADLASRGVDWQNPKSSLIFGDGAACAIVEKGNGMQRLLGFRQHTHPSHAALCEIRAGGTRRNPRSGMEDSDFLFQMQGTRLFRQTTPLMQAMLDGLLSAAHLTLADIERVIPHQASHLGMSHMRERLGIDNDKLVDIYATHGNQVAASLPTALHEAHGSGRLPRGAPAALIGTGAGLTLAGLVWQL
ncbi:3-oxoacyl-[acyl-carrier-protein] synthase III C-terminal domain-containing protein [Kerstersia gyiorum]|uniref:3-oxoacyl-[acyl-carrier-protein] synthase III C-terminal domain-containing protein n=1 Tax=Kerstersia gyiorum TaxID=206506 RepID=UPI0039EA38CD